MGWNKQEVRFFDFCLSPNLSSENESGNSRTPRKTPSSQWMNVGKLSLEALEPANLRRGVFYLESLTRGRGAHGLRGAAGILRDR